jgi:hypothetical protein
MGNAVFEKIGPRAMTIFLHSPWSGVKDYGSSWVLPAEGIIDSLIATMPEQYGRVGFDVLGTPFESLPGRNSVYQAGYDPFVLGKFCDGYIFQGTGSMLEPVTVIRDFVNEENLARAREQSGDGAARTAGPEYFYQETKSAADMRTRFKNMVR